MYLLGVRIGDTHYADVYFDGHVVRREGHDAGRNAEREGVACFVGAFHRGILGEARLRAASDPYPAARYEVTATAREIAENFDETKGNYGDVRIAGRIMTRRIMGSASFFELQDHTGKIQVYIKRDEVCGGDPESTLYNKVFKKLLDIGDFIGVEGFAFHTNTGELSVHCRKFTVLSKSIRPLPVVN